MVQPAVEMETGLLAVQAIVLAVVMLVGPAMHARTDT